MAEERDLEAAAAALMLCRWLDGQDADLRGLLLSHGRLRRFSRRQWAFAEGDDSGGILIVVRGRFQLYSHTLGDREVLLDQLSRGSTIGQSVHFGGGPRLVTLISLDESLVLKVDDDALVQIAERQPLIWKAIASLHYAQLRGMIQRIAEFTSLPPRQRLAARLIRFATGHDTVGALKLSQQDLADMTGLSRKTANECLTDLQDRGLIHRRYAAIDIVDLPGLQAYAAMPGGAG